jgi:hypothetical protein
MIIYTENKPRASHAQRWQVTNILSKLVEFYLPVSLRERDGASPEFPGLRGTRFLRLVCDTAATWWPVVKSFLIAMEQIYSPVVGWWPHEKVLELTVAPAVYVYVYLGWQEKAFVSYRPPVCYRYRTTMVVALCLTLETSTGQELTNALYLTHRAESYYWS